MVKERFWRKRSGVELERQGRQLDSWLGRREEVIHEWSGRPDDCGHDETTKRTERLREYFQFEGSDRDQEQ